MSSYKEYKLKGLNARYFPQENSIVFISKGLPDQYVKKVINRIETILQVQSTTMNNDGSFTVKLDQNTGTNADELLRSLGFQGGKEHEDAVGDDEKLQQDQTNNNQQQPQDQQQMQQPDETQQLAAHKTFSNLYNVFYESTYRTADYWRILERPSGKNKNQLSEPDILRLRRRFTSKPTSQYRDRVLRALDKAAGYFTRRLKNQDPVSKSLARRKGKPVNSPQAEAFKQKYKSIGNLVPSDYAELKDKVSVQKPTSSQFTDVSPANDIADNLKLSDIVDFDDVIDTDAYDKPEEDDF